MSKKTLGLIVVLAIISGILFYVALSQSNPTPLSQPQVIKPNPAQSVLSMAAEPASTGSAQTVDVNINTYSNNVTAVQLEITYDPKIITYVRVNAGTFLDNPVQLFNTVDQKNGRISYAIGIPPTGTGKKGQGIVATINFSTLPNATQPATFTFAPKTKVAAEGVSQSVLRNALNLTLPLPTK